MPALRQRIRSMRCSECSCAQMPPRKLIGHPLLWLVLIHWTRDADHSEPVRICDLEQVH